MSHIEWGVLFNDAKTASFDALPPGEYDVYVAEAEAKVAQTSGKQMIKTKLQVESGPHAGRIVWNNHVLSPDSPQAMGFWFREMKAWGLDTEFFTKGSPSMEMIAVELVNRRARIKTEKRVWNGQEQTDVKQIKPAVGPAPVAGSPTPSAAPSAAPTSSATPSPAPAPVTPSTPVPEAPSAF